jgi:hypothetical protein
VEAAAVRGKFIAEMRNPMVCGYVAGGLMAVYAWRGLCRWSLHVAPLFAKRESNTFE